MTHPLVRPFDRAVLRRQFRDATPFPFIAIDNFLEPSFALEVARAYPNYAEAREKGHEFSALNEKRKVQITGPAKFPDPIRRLKRSSARRTSSQTSSTSPASKSCSTTPSSRGVACISPGRAAGSMCTSTSTTSRSRRFTGGSTSSVYLNENWKDEWGGAVELWDKDVRRCEFSAKPILNRCVAFATSDISFHGVEPVKCPPNTQRASFAAYYYTKEAPPHWDGAKNSTVFRARPYERVRSRVLIPLQKARAELIASTKQVVKKVIGRS